MKLEWMRCFAEIAETGSINKAAENLYLSQPAVTKMMQALEKELTYAEKLTSQQELAMSFLADNLTDEQAVQVPLIFEAWQVGVDYKVGKKLVYEEVLYKVLQDHTSQETWTPKDAPSLFARVLVDDGGAVLDWVQPDSTNPYMKGDRVKFEGKIYESLIDSNVWSPTAYPAGWKEIS